MSVHEDVMDGIICLQCHMMLISDDDEVCEAGFPVYCEDCFKELPKKTRREGASYFCEKTGTIACPGE